EEVKAIFGNIIQNEIHQHRAGLWHVALGQSAAVEAERSHRPYSSRMAMMSLLNELSSGLMPLANSSWRSFLAPIAWPSIPRLSRSFFQRATTSSWLSRASRIKRAPRDVSLDCVVTMIDSPQIETSPLYQKQGANPATIP